MLRPSGGGRVQPAPARRLNREGRLFLTHTVLNGRYTLRFCVGQTHTEAAHVRRAWELIQAAAQASPAQAGEGRGASVEGEPKLGAGFLLP